MVFYEPWADVTIPNLKIGDPDFTIAFWIRLSKPNQRVRIWSSSRSANGLNILIHGRMFFEFVEWGPFGHSKEISSALFSRWFHVAVTFEQDEVKIFINGETFLTVGSTIETIETFVVHYVSSPLIMDLHIFGFALPPDDIYDLSRG